MSAITVGNEPRRTALVVSGEARLPRLVKVALEPGRFQVVANGFRMEVAREYVR